NNAVPLINVETEKAEKLFQSALNDLELADKFKSDDFITKDIIATINLQLGNKDKAIDGFQEAIPYGNRYISELRESVKKDGDKEGLKEKEIESTFKNIVNAYINIFNLYTEREESEKALEALNKVLEFDPANKEALLQMAKYYENRKEFEKALPMYEKMLEIEPDNIDVLFNQGILFKSSKDIDKAIVNFEKIIGINPDDAETMYFLALFYTEKEQYQKVVNLIEPKFENFSDEWKDKVSDYIQVALVKIGRAIDAKNYQRN
ncbi:MAG: tetratricopeptide repeat protein, partial [Candidatus Delongbacteria bacterium]|nr:tetratricopeptide repeat protein [Candidatus Delongbacteria bacterium]